MGGGGLRVAGICVDYRVVDLEGLNKTLEPFIGRPSPVKH